MKLLRCMTLLFLVAVLAGCVPWPHRQWTAPRISGTVVRSGQPVAGVHVQLADVMNAAGDLASTAKTQETVTDAAGHFSIGPIRRFSWTTSAPVFNVSQHTIPWGLRLSTQPPVWHAGWLSDATLFGEVLKTPIVATCDVDAPSRSSVIKGQLALVGNGPCNLALPESSQ